MKIRIYESNEIEPSYYDGDIYYWDGESKVPKDVTKVVIQDSVTSIGKYAFYDCTRLTSITIPDSVTSIGRSAFEGCTGLISVTIPKSVISIDNYAFENCTGLTSISIPNSVIDIGLYVFTNCTNLTSVIIPDSVKLISWGTFKGCVSLTSIKIPDNVTSVGDGAFQGCTGLTNITIGNGVTWIGRWAFDGCTSLTSITIPDSVTSIDEYAFDRCKNLKSVIFKGDILKIEFGDNVFRGTPYENESKKFVNITDIAVKNIDDTDDTDFSIDINTEKIKFVKLPDEVFEGEAAEKVISKELRTPIDNLVVVKFSTSDGSVSYDSFEYLDQYLSELAEDELSVNDDFDINTLATLCNANGIKFVDVGDYDQFNKTEYTRYLVFKNKSDAKKLINKIDEELN